MTTTLLDLPWKTPEEVFSLDPRHVEQLQLTLLKERFEDPHHNIGAGFLDGWVDIDLEVRRVSVRALSARTVHINAGNSPQIALQTVIANAISRCNAIVKLPANDPYAAPAIVKTLIAMAPDHPITSTSASPTGKAATPQ